MSVDTVQPRTYGNWRKPSSPGIGRLGTLGTGVLLGGLVVCIILLAVFGPLVAGGGVLVLGLVCAPLVVPVAGGRNGFQAIAARAAWAHGKLRGGHLLISGPLAPAGRAERCGLPGLAASMTATEGTDTLGQPFALLHLPKVQHATVVLCTSPDGAALVDAGQVDQWVAAWGAWLASLAHEPALVAASVTIEAAPDSGHKLMREVSGQISHNAPLLAVQVLEEIAGTYPAGAASITSRVALTFSTTPRPGTSKARKAADVAGELGNRIPALAAGLGATGAGPARAMTVAELAAAVRVAYDPALGVTVDQLGSAAAGVTWENAGPTGAVEQWDSYRHDSAVSVTWQMVEAPRGTVFANALERLAAPHHDIDRKRVTILYRPHDPASAAKAVDRDHLDAIYAANGKKVGRARDSVSLAAARKSAEEEATGAGVVRFGLLVTASVTDPERLPLAVAAIENMGTASRIGLRRCYGSQAAAFTAALPLGLVLPAHLRVPQALREAM